MTTCVHMEREWQSVCSKWLLILAAVANGILITLMVAGCNISPSSVQRGLPASWRTQLSIAQQAAIKVDKDAVLWDVTEHPSELRPSHWSYISDTLKTEFKFYRPSGDAINIRFDDTSPTSTLTIEQSINPDYKKGFNPVLTPQLLSKSLATVIISPREAVQLTWADALAHASQRNITISPIIGLTLGSTPAEWRVQYVGSDRPTLYLGNDMSYTVDAHTGAILTREYTPFAPFGKP